MRLAVAVVCLSVAGLCVAAEAVAAIRKQTSIPAQGLVSALNTLAEDRDFQVVYRSDVVGTLRTAGATGELTTDEALSRLLDGTGLTYRYLDDSTVTIISVTSAAQERGGGASVTQTPVAPPSEPSRAAGPQSSADDARPSMPSSESAPAAGLREELQEIIVTGSRIKRFGGEGPVPVVTFARDEFERLGVTDVADVFDYLPQSSFAPREEHTFGGARAIQLRGLNLGTTLVLINGRRVVTSALQGARNFFDLNMIPLAAVERIEVLSDGASAVYGADAMGGVVNIILKKDIDRPVLDVYLGSAKGGGEEKRASLSFGHDTDRLRSMFTFDAFDRDPLPGSERSLLANQDYRRFGAADARVTAANPGNIYSLSGAPLPGLSTTSAGVPAGSSGVGLIPADFAATDGVLNLDSISRYSSVVPEGTRLGAFGAIEFDLTDSTTAFVELLYTHADNDRLLTPASLANGRFGTYTVPASNPFNPFGVDVGVDYLFTGLGAREDKSESEFGRALAGLTGRIGSSAWDWNVAVTHSDDQGNDVIENEIDPLRVVAALNATDPAQALNVFQDGPGGSAELLRSLVRDRIVDRMSSTATQVDGYVSGPLFDLPAGAVELVVGGEWREEAIDMRFHSFNMITKADRGSRAAFSEVLVPIVGPDMNVPLIERLALTAAGRLDRYSDVGDTFNPQFGLEWNPYPGLLLRASAGTAFRPPSLFELHQALSVLSGAFIPDPRRNGEVAAIDLINGGNTELDPEEADTLVAGFVFQPQSLRGLDLSVDYWHIDQSRRVLRTDPITVLNNEARFADRVVRAAPTSADVAAGLPGRLLSVDTSNLNFGGVDTKGYDFRGQYRFDAGPGQIGAALAATYVQSFEVADFPGKPPRERVGIAHRDGTVPKWKATASLTWAWRGLQLGATGRYTHSYLDADFTNALTGREIGAAALLDLQGAYTFGRGDDASVSWLDGLVLRAGAINALDREPQFSDVAFVGYDPSQADLRQRFIYVSASKAF